MYDYINTLKDYGIKVYPNPVSSQLTINSKEFTIISIVLYDVIGNKLYEYKIQQTQVEIDFISFEKGIYLLKVFLIDGKSVNYKVVKR